jgi:fluoride ion exporter CrcB/FEX
VLGSAILETELVKRLLQAVEAKNELVDGSNGWCIRCFITLCVDGMFEDVTRKTAFPWVILGGQCHGFFVGWVWYLHVAHERQWLTVPQQHLLSVGFLGAFTTYSAFSLDCVRLMQAGAVDVGGQLCGHPQRCYVLPATAIWHCYWCRSDFLIFVLLRVDHVRSKITAYRYQ